MRRWGFAVFLAWQATAVAQGSVSTDPASILAIPDPLREQFARTVLTGQVSRKERLERLVAYVFDARGLGMRYEDGATHTVAQSWETRRANCLGFTLLFVALAREAGLEAYPQAWEETLAWHRSEGVLYRDNHVNASVRVGPRSYTLDVVRGDVITRGDPLRLTEIGLLARYHNNIAVEALEAGDLAAAQEHMATALQLDDAQASHWSNAGVLALRRGDEAAALQAYDRALALDPDNVNALFNRVNLARRANDAASEAQFRERLARAQQKDPFHHFLQAVDLELAGDLPRAIGHYRLALRLYGGDHRLHAALANALERTGDAAGARASLRRAVALSEGKARDAYRERLRHLPLQ